MSEIHVLPVRNRREREIFLKFPWRIYKNDPLWVPPLLPDLRRRIDPQGGIFFQRGSAEFFIAWRDGRPVGTICAADDRATNEQRGSRDCMFGFFEFIEDYKVMEALLLRATEWALVRGLETLFGPFNLDYEDGYGILLEGRDRPPALLCGHTPPYYQGFVENYGFEPARGDNLAYALDLTQASPIFEEMSRKAERVRQRKHFVIRKADLAHWEEEIERIYILLNRALAHLPDFIPWQREAVFDSLAPFRTIVDPELVLFADLDGETIGWLPGIPNLNEATIHANGLRYPWDYLKLWWFARQGTECLAVKSVLVMPEHWGSGLAILFIDEMLKRARAKGFKWLDLSMTSDDNPRTPVLAERLGAKLYKRYRVYRKKL